MRRSGAVREGDDESSKATMNCRTRRYERGGWYPKPRKAVLYNLGEVACQAWEHDSNRDQSSGSTSRLMRAVNTTTTASRKLSLLRVGCYYMHSRRVSLASVLYVKMIISVVSCPSLWK